MNVLYNLHHQPGAPSQPDAPSAPLPIRASFLQFWNELATAYRQFAASPPTAGHTGLTFFLQTVDAYRIYRKAATAFETMQEQCPANAVLLRSARAFRADWRGSIQQGMVPT